MECSTNKLLDHLIGAGKQRGRHVQSDRFRGFEVDDQLERRRLFHRQVCRFRASLSFQNVTEMTQVSVAGSLACKLRD